ncbi:MAG: class I SAM-dependent methyltransferase [Betaproteobacteria bacterium]
MRALARLLPLLFFVTAIHATTPEPYVGQPGKDVVWVPTPEALVEKMLDMAKVTPQDYVIDLGSGDGRNVIAAARRGARALGVEFDPGLVELARRNARAAGVGNRARFVRGDMYQADISKATVLALFLLPQNLEELKPKFQRLRPGTRIVVNGYEIPGWEPTEVGKTEGECSSWCTAYLYIVPAKSY